MDQRAHVRLSLLPFCPLEIIFLFLIIAERIVDKIRILSKLVCELRLELELLAGQMLLFSVNMLDSVTS